jgi:hypothetical protein
MRIAERRPTSSGAMAGPPASPDRRCRPSMAAIGLACDAMPSVLAQPARVSTMLEASAITKAATVGRRRLAQSIGRPQSSSTADIGISSACSAFMAPSVPA